MQTWPRNVSLTVPTVLTTGAACVPMLCGLAHMNTATQCLHDQAYSVGNISNMCVPVLLWTSSQHGCAMSV